MRSISELKIKLFAGASNKPLVPKSYVPGLLRSTSLMHLSREHLVLPTKR